MEQRLPAGPEPWPETQAYWDAANAGELLLYRCRETGKPFHYPRAHSPFSGQANVETFRASGKGTIYTYSVMMRAKPPYCLAYVKLAEGPTMMTNIITDKFDQLFVGQQVKLCFVPASTGQQIPMFTPDDNAGG